MATITELTEPMRHETDRGRIVGRLREVANAALDVVGPQANLAVELGTDSYQFMLGFDEPVLAADGVYEMFEGRLTRAALRHLASRFQIPLPYLDRLIDQHRDLADTNVNTLGSRHQGNVLYRLLRGEDGWLIRAVTSDSYRALDNTDLLTAVAKGMGEADISLGDCEAETDWSNDRFRLRLAVPAIELAVPDLLAGYRWPFSHARGSGTHDPAQPGEIPPVLWAGIEVANSETGGGALTIVPRAVVLVCKNGLTRTQDMVRNVHLGGKLGDGAVTWSHETHQKALALITSQIADATRQFVSVEYLTTIANEMRAAKGIEVVSVTNAMVVVQQRLGFTDDETSSVLDAFMRGGDSSVLGLGQAVTAAAQLVADGDRQSEMEDAFWAIVRQPAQFVGAA